MKLLTNKERAQMERNGQTIRCWYEIEKSRVPFHKDFTNREEALAFNRKLDGVRLKQVTEINRRTL